VYANRKYHSCECELALLGWYLFAFIYLIGFSSPFSGYYEYLYFFLFVVFCLGNIFFSPEYIVSNERVISE
jgi:hypothetical protein